jgi:RHS repeat-associated protein
MVENHSGGYQFVYAPNGGKQPLAEMQGQSLLGTFLPLPGGAIVAYNSSGLLQYMHADWLGSARLSSTPGRVAIPDMAYAPFGEGYAGGQQYVQFTGINAGTVDDTENQTGSLEDFMFRRYSPVQGRWISPDPAGLGAVDPSNPQTWNRYAYVTNNPNNYIDPLGLGGCGDARSNTAPCRYVPNGEDLNAWLWELALTGVVTTEIIDKNGDISTTWVVEYPFVDVLGFIANGPGGADNGNCIITVNCRGIQTDNLGKLGFQHCDAQVTDSSGGVWSLSGGPQPNYMSITALNAWATSPPTEPFTGTTVYQGNSCTAAGCMIQSTQAWNQDIVKPEYGPVTGPNSNTWLKGTAAGCGVSLPINTWGSIW